MEFTHINMNQNYYFILENCNFLDLTTFYYYFFKIYNKLIYIYYYYIYLYYIFNLYRGLI